MPPDIPTLRRWLTDVLGEEPPDWEINSTSKHILEELYFTHQRQAAAAALEMEELQEARCEFQAEINRLSQILNKLGGLEEEMTSGLSGSYLNTLSELALALDLDLVPGSTTCAPSLQAALAKLLVKQVRGILLPEYYRTQAELGPRVGLVKAEVEKGEVDMLELHARLARHRFHLDICYIIVNHARLEELAEQANVVERAGEQASGGQKKKTEFTLAKVGADIIIIVMFTLA